VTYNIGVGQLAQTQQQVDMATPDVAKQSTHRCTDAAGSQH